MAVNILVRDVALEDGELFVGLLIVLLAAAAGEVPLDDGGLPDVVLLVVIGAVFEVVEIVTVELPLMVAVVVVTCPTTGPFSPFPDVTLPVVGFPLLFRIFI